MLNHKEILDQRRKYIGPSLSISYDVPLHIVRGEAQYLFDVKGNRYLNCVNNIQHVGHCHPKIVEAAQSQYKKLNTNTRYLDEAIVNYARNLTQTLPDGFLQKAFELVKKSGGLCIAETPILAKQP